jgi:hypothetical protein
MNRVLPLIIFLFFISFVYAEGRRGHLTSTEVERVRAFKELLGSVDSKTVRQTVDDLGKNDYPQVNLQMKEAMAKTYADIVRDKNVEGHAKQERLYSMVALNMAYLQLGGTRDKAGSTEPLNRLIRQKLRAYLPPEIFNRPGFSFVVE